MVPVPRRGAAAGNHLRAGELRSAGFLKGESHGALPREPGQIKPSDRLRLAWIPDPVQNTPVYPTYLFENSSKTRRALPQLRFQAPDKNVGDVHGGEKTLALFLGVLARKKRK